MTKYNASEAMKARWKDPAFREFMLQIQKKVQDERMRKRINELGGKKK